MPAQGPVARMRGGALDSCRARIGAAARQG